MITLIVFSIANELFFHFDLNVMTENIKIIILVIFVASDMNLFAIWGSRK